MNDEFVQICAVDGLDLKSVRELKADSEKPSNEFLEAEERLIEAARIYDPIAEDFDEADKLSTELVQALPEHTAASACNVFYTFARLGVSWGLTWSCPLPPGVHFLTLGELQ